MISTLSLGLTLLWGAVLAFGCRLFLAVAEGIRSAAAAVYYYGLGGAVCEMLAEKNPVPVLRIGVKDVFGESGPAEEVLSKYGLDAEGIYNAIKGWK